jgi:hypothetical protein
LIPNSFPFRDSEILSWIPGFQIEILAEEFFGALEETPAPAFVPQSRDYGAAGIG